MPFEEDLRKKDFLITAELLPPRGTEVTELLKQAEELKPYVDAFILPDNPGAKLRAAPLGLVHILQSEGFETLPGSKQTCLQADLLAAGSLGIRNVLAVTGDHNLLGDHPASKPVYDLDSVQLLALVKNLNMGLDANERPLTIFMMERMCVDMSVIF
ncbi:methylenetetrahydrofolate reductase [Desulfosporosinus sp. BICA1-9]|uniref:methylenetetrahydrofolate reductase n=1 Tax=Desulfosporosinus sp. BICA1-9 TaxID=1531958 RepID=UPI000AFF18E7|nr:methylenetetrahydrofolate reductase [Desulfosporosinus sp. BICA1-9]